MTSKMHCLFLVTGSILLLSPVVGHEAFAQTGTQRPGVTVAYTIEAAATVEAINQDTRGVLLRGAGGHLFAVTAGPAVENLSRVKPGDHVFVRYDEALAVSLGKSGQEGGGTATEQASPTRHVAPGSRPTSAVRNQISATVTIDTIDRATHTVTFTGPANAARTVVVKDAEAQRFLNTVKPGDRVDLVYTEALAVAVEPMGK
jgi:hypothetical protein